MRGRLITFEGIDGCGKSTQLHLLAQRLQGLGFPVRCFREPGGTELSERIRALLLDAAYEIVAEAELLLFAAARAQLVWVQLQPALRRGEIVLCDRFADSTTAYQGYGRGLPLELVQACNRLAADGLQPDVTVLLELPVALALQRSGRGDRMEQGALEFFERVREGYLELARQEPERILVIDAQGSPEAVHERIWRELRARFGWE